MTLALRSELVSTAKRMHELGLAPGTSGNVSVRCGNGLLVTPTGIPYAELTPDDVVMLDADGTARTGQRLPTSEWALHCDLLAARPDIGAIVHTHSDYCTTIACLRRPLPAIHYLIALAGTHEVPCAEYATYGSPELAANVVRALGGASGSNHGRAALMANHGMVALADSLGGALKIAAEIETVAGHYWRALQVGSPVILDADEVERVGAKLRQYGQGTARPKRSW